MHERAFGLADQESFARLSGDHNPIHVDPLKARRLLFGRPVVHGIHSLLSALDGWAATNDRAFALESLTARFPKPIFLNQQVTCAVTHETHDTVHIALSANGAITVTLKFVWRGNPPGTGEAPISSSPAECEPRDPGIDEIATCRGTLDLHLDGESARALFPNLQTRLPPDQLAVLLATTRLVGMHCPGLHSLYSDLELHWSDRPSTRSLGYAVDRFDPRLGLVRVALDGANVAGSLRAFVLPAPRRQPGVAELKAYVDPAEFANQNALIVGGSRGLGEITAKLLAAGGAVVTVTYRSGNEEAARVVEDITRNGGRADSAHCDIQADLSGITATRSPQVAFTHLYYFATPPIGSTDGTNFSVPAFTTFCEFYVSGFARLVDALRGKGLQHAFYPSTVFAEELPNGMDEYVAAKTAGEAHCRYLRKHSRDMDIYCPRLPKLATDQTVSLFQDSGADPVPVLLEHLRRFAMPAGERNAG
ncbi:SDR family NAD(P)-dependent oxidoreductase [Arhodomonas sp. AD133]|uniref:SDR family NAD(P)-dependent oxidoreductase n=1 Tax=Arhodomonas sp. AD133 TaxID=3415009 RepID=UPI003EB8C60C